MRVALVATALALAIGTSSSAAAPLREARLAVVVGADRGEDGETALHYARLDAERVRDLLTELGDVASARAILVRAEAPAEIREALREAAGRAAELHDAGYRVTFLFYYSGHGDEDSLHLHDGRFRIDELHRLVDAMHADVRLVILDSCRGMGRVKGVTPAAEFDLSAVPRGPTGSVEIRASADGEAAQESDDLRGSVFTHFLLSGLRGAADADGDRRVTLAELYAYAYRRTLLRTQTGPGMQHATLTVDLKGSGELVLAVPGAAAATLFVPPGGQHYLVVATPSAAVIGELTGEGGGFALPAGRYLVVARDTKVTRVAEIDLSNGGTRRLGPNDFREVPRDRLVPRGGWIELRQSRVRVGLGSDLAIAQPERPTATLELGYVRLAGAMFYELDARSSYGGVDGVAMTGHAETVAGAALVGRRWRTSPRVELGVAAGPEVRYGREQVKARDPQLNGFDTNASFAYGAVGVRARARLDLSLGANALVELELSGLAAMRPVADPYGRAMTTYGALFALGPAISFAHAF
jgi:hypothetical protein